MGCLPPGHVWYNQTVAQYPFDPEKAKQLLGNKPLSLTLLIENSPLDVKMAELMKISLAKADITLNVKSVDSKTRDAALAGKDFELVLIKTGNMGKDADYLRTYYGAPAKGHSINSGSPGYYNESIHRLAQQQMHEMDPAKRKQIIFELQERRQPDRLPACGAGLSPCCRAKRCPNSITGREGQFSPAINAAWKSAPGK